VGAAGLGWEHDWVVGGSGGEVALDRSHRLALPQRRRPMEWKGADHEQDDQPEKANDPAAGEA
jgi:hypothetical protein